MPIKRKQRILQAFHSSGPGTKEMY